MPQVFISYAREDAVIAKRLTTAIAASGYAVWWDRELTAGQQLNKAIPKALEDSDCVLVLWSSHALESTWVHSEAARAVDRGVFVPVSLDGDHRPPMPFDGFVAARLESDWDGDSGHPDFAHILASIEHIAGRPAAGTPIDSPEPALGGVEVAKRYLRPEILVATLVGALLGAITIAWAYIDFWIEDFNVLRLTTFGAVGGATVFIADLRAGRIKDQFGEKALMDVYGGAALATLSPVTAIAGAAGGSTTWVRAFFGSEFFLAFLVGIAWSGIIHGFRGILTRIVTTMFREQISRELTRLAETQKSAEEDA